MVRVVPGRGVALDRVALQVEAKVVPLVVQAGQLLVKVVRQRKAERHLEPAARRTLRSGRGRDDRKGRRRRETVQLPVGFTSAAGTDLAVSIPEDHCFCCGDTAAGAAAAILEAPRVFAAIFDDLIVASVCVASVTAV